MAARWSVLRASWFVEELAQLLLLDHQLALQAVVELLEVLVGVAGAAALRAAGERGARLLERPARRVVGLVQVAGGRVGGGVERGRGPLGRRLAQVARRVGGVVGDGAPRVVPERAADRHRGGRERDVLGNAAGSGEGDGRRAAVAVLLD